MTDPTPRPRRILPPNADLSGKSETRMLLGALVTIASDLSSTLDLSELLHKVMHQARDVMSVEGCALFFLNSSLDAFEEEIALATNGELLRRTCNLPVTRGIVGHVAREGAPILANDPATRDDFDPEVDQVIGFTAQHLLCVPLKTNDGLIGVAQVINRHDRQGFNEDDLILFQAFADMAAVAIANARLHEDAIQRRRLEQEMNVARDIQKSLLPSTFPEFEGFRFEATSQPAFHVGGDLYDIFAADENTVCVAVGDVSGKGPPAALYMACLQSELHLAMDFIHEPTAVMSRLNTIMRARSRHGAYITLILTMIDRTTRRATVLSAGHPEPLLYTPAKGVQPVEVQYGYPLGVESSATYETVEIDFPPGAALLSYTDGVTEARNSRGEEYEVPALKLSFANAIGRGGPLLPPILEDLNRFTVGASQYDDLTLAIVRSDA